MRIKSKSPYLSIENLQEIELADFAVLVGRNGVGKTQLLQAIRRGAVTVDDMLPSEIALYDLDSFRPQDSKSASWEQCASATLQADRFFRLGDPSPAVVAKEILDNVANEFNIVGDCKRRQLDNELRDGIEIVLEGGEFSPSRVKRCTSGVYQENTDCH